MKNQLSAKLLLLLLVVVYSLNGQVITESKGPKDSTQFLLQNYPLLTPPVTVDNAITPYYKLFYLLGDGEYEMDTIMNNGSDEFNHRYPEIVQATSTTSSIAASASLMATAYNPRVYAISTYSNGAPPPDRLQAGPFGNNTDRINYPQAVLNRSVVEPDEYLKLFPHADAKKGEPLVYILSFKNPLETRLIRNTLFLLYNGKIREVKIASNGDRRVRETGKEASFSVKDVLVHSSRVDSRVNEFSTQLNTQLRDVYQKAMAFDLNGLNPGEEGRVFVEFTVDSINYDYFNGKYLGEVDFTAILVTHDNELAQNDYLAPKERSFINNIRFDSTLILANANASDIVYEYYQPTDTTGFFEGDADNGEVPGFGNVLDVATHTVSLVKEHDPNYLTVDACPCPDDETRRKLFITIHAENDGLGEVFLAYLDMELPAGINADDVIGTPVSYHPYNADLNSDDFIEFEKLDDKNIRWTFSNQHLRSVQEFGIGDPRTFVEVQFMAFTDVEPSSLDSVLQSCIRFNSLTNDAFCTYPVPVTLITGDDAEKAELLSCESCKEDPPKGIPCWVWITLLVLLLLILLIWLIRRN